MTEGDLHREANLVHLDRDPADPHLRDKLIERFISLSGTLTRKSSVAGVAEAMGTAALTLTGAQRAAVYHRPETGAIDCLWSHGFPAEEAARIVTAEKIDAGPVLLPELASWPLVRSGKTIGVIVCGFETPREWFASEIDVMLALALHGAAALERAFLFEASGGRTEAEPNNVELAEALRTAQAESAHIVEAQRELEAQHARLVRARRTLGAVNVWLLALRRDLVAKRARLAAEQARVTKALDDVSSEDARVTAARETLGTQLAAADQALERESVRLAAMCQVPVETGAPPPDPRRETPDDAPPSNPNPPAEVERAKLAERTKLMEALGLASAQPAETQDGPQPAGAAPSLPAAEPVPEPPSQNGRPAADPAFSYELGGPLPAPRALEDLYPTLVDRAAELLRANGQPLTEEQQLAMLGRALDDRDGHRAGYGERLASWAEAVAGVLGCGREAIADIRRAAVLHDLGKVAVPEAVLHSAGALTEEERSALRLEPIMAEQVLSPVKGMRGVATILRHRYERWDGKGYPDGLHEKAIPLGARILAVVDAYGAMTTARRHRTMVYTLDAIVELRRCAGSQFDPEVVEAFLGVLERER